MFSLPLFVVLILIFAAVRCAVTQPVGGAPAVPAGGTPTPRPGPTADAPVPRNDAAVPATTCMVTWESLRNSCRWLIVIANFALLGPVFFAAAGLGEVLYGEDLPQWALLLLAIVTGVVIFMVWEDPTRRKVLGFAKAAVQARGVAPEQLTDETYIGISAACCGERLGKCPDMVGFIELTSDACVLHTLEKDVTIPKADLAPLARGTLRGETMGWMGVQPIAVSWRATGEADPNTIYLIAKYAETSYEVAAATDMLFQRLTQWAADATPHAPVEPAATKASTDRA